MHETPEDLAALVGAGLDYRVALLPLLVLVAAGALQTLRHPRALAPAAA